MIITSIIKISAGNIIKGQIDTTWVVFWLQAEASIAVMVVSISAFRALFIVDGSKNHKAPQQSPSSRRWLQPRSRTAHEGFPSIPSPIMTGVKTLIGHTSTRSHYRNQSDESDGICLQTTAPGIRVTHDITTDRVRESVPDSYDLPADSFSTNRTGYTNHPTSPLSDASVPPVCLFFLSACLGGIDY